MIFSIVKMHLEIMTKNTLINLLMCILSIACFFAGLKVFWSLHHPAPLCLSASSALVVKSKQYLRKWYEFSTTIVNMVL